MKEYERLTARQGKDIYVENMMGTFVIPNCSKTCQKAINRLAELETKIENGTLIELPCKVGDKIYFDTWVGGVNVGVQGHQVIGFNLSALVKRNGAIISTEIPIKAVGIDVFLTKAEAEQRLKELQNERN